MNSKYDILQYNLENLGFGALEAKIYLELLSGKSMSAYQLAKKIDIARASIYNTIEHMLEKGMIRYVPNKTPLYTACEPGLLLNKLKEKMDTNISNASIMLKEYEKTRVSEDIIMIKGYENIIIKAKELLMNATHDIYINTDIDVDVFENEFRELNSRNINIYIFSFYKIRKGGEFVNLFSHDRKKSADYNESRFMMAEYDKVSLTAGCNSKFDDWSAIVSNVPLDVRILEEHIHNDIYMLKLRDTYGKKIYSSIQIGTEFEKEDKLRR